MHKKKTAVHCLIISSFLFYAFFIEGPISEKLSVVGNEAKLCGVDLPAETNNINWSFDQLPADAHIIEPAGWAFIEDGSPEGGIVYIVFRSDSKTYVFNTEPRLRSDIAQAFLGRDLDWAGFAATIPTRKIEDGNYTVGIYIEKNEIEALEYTDHFLVKRAESVETTSVAPFPY
jgi:hypothetical protein